MQLRLSDIKTPIKEELKEFERYFKEAMRSKVPLLDRITYYIVQRKGKQMRPMFVFLSAKLCGTVNSHTYAAASLIELLHTASLVHDDVVDDAFKRRGFFSINALWKNKIAVLVGDYFLSKGMLIAIENERFDLLKILSKSVKAMIEGELLQIEKARKLDIKEDIYYEVIRQKTASLISSACGSGAASVNVDTETVCKMELLGEKIGMAFQIKDDLFDYGEDDIGKPRGIDIKEKKMTLPLIYALQKADKTQRRTITNYIKNHSTKKEYVNKVIAFVKESGGIEYTKEVMLKYKQESLDILAEFDDSEARQGMIDLINFVTERTK